MATLTISATNDGGVTFTRTKNLSEADTSRLIAWAKDQYNVATVEQAFNSMADGIFSALRSNVLTYERNQAARAAEDNVADVVIS